MLTLPRSLRLILPAVVLALAVLTVAPRAARAQTSLDVSYAIGVEHASQHPYNYTGRLFDLDNIAFGSGTLIRRQTVLTAGHVVFDATNGFIVNATFSRGLYQDYAFSKHQIIAVSALSGYQTAVTADTENSLAAFAFDMGFAILREAPPDNDWGSYYADPGQLADATNQFFVLGYPGVTFDGRTMAYIVPSTVYTAVGAVGSALYENDGYVPESGESGGPIYVVNDQDRHVVAETLGGAADTTGEFNSTFVRAIDQAANNMLRSAEYAAGQITHDRIRGPHVVSHGSTVTFRVLPQFLVPNVGTTTVASTDRYDETKLRTSTPGTSTNPAVTIKKISNTRFLVTFASTIRPRSTTTLTAYYNKTTAVPNSTITITVD